MAGNNSNNKNNLTNLQKKFGVGSIYTYGCIDLPLEPSYYHSRRPLFVYLGKPGLQHIKAYQNILNESLLAYMEVRKKYNARSGQPKGAAKLERDAEFKPVVQSVLEKVKFIQGDGSQEFLPDKEAYRKVCSALRNKARAREEASGKPVFRSPAAGPNTTKAAKRAQRDWQIDHDLATGKRQRHPSQVGKPLPQSTALPPPATLGDAPPTSSLSLMDDGGDDTSIHNGNDSSAQKFEVADTTEVLSCGPPSTTTTTENNTDHLQYDCGSGSSNSSSRQRTLPTRNNSSASSRIISNHNNNLSMIGGKSPRHFVL